MERKADKLWTIRIIRSAKGRCQICAGSDVHAHHIIIRSMKLWRHAQVNGVCLCTGCHAWAHAEPALFEVWLQFHRPMQYAILAHRLDAMPMKYHLLLEARIKELT